MAAAVAALPAASLSVRKARSQLNLIGEKELACHSVDELQNMLRRLREGRKAVVVAFLPKCDVSIRITYHEYDASVRVRAVFREESACGGTWWTSSQRRVLVAGSDDETECVASAVLDDIAELHALFARLLEENRTTMEGER